MDTTLESPPVDNSLARAILWNADCGPRPDGVLTTAEILGLHQQLNKTLATTDGDAGTHEISTRQLAPLLACAVKANEMQKALEKIKDLLKQHPEFSEGNSKVHYCAHLARSTASMK